jgi:hypothetical protein
MGGGDPRTSDMLHAPVCRRIGLVQAHMGLGSVFLNEGSPRETPYPHTCKVVDP